MDQKLEILSQQLDELKMEYLNDKKSRNKDEEIQLLILSYKKVLKDSENKKKQLIKELEEIDFVIMNLQKYLKDAEKKLLE